MSDINKIKVNGEVFNINTFAIGPEEPIGVERMSIWIKPRMETYTSGPNNLHDPETSNTNYITFNEETNQLEAVDSSYPNNKNVVALYNGGSNISNINEINPCNVVGNKEYLVKFMSNGNTIYTGTTFGLIYLNNNKEFISKEEKTCTGDGKSSYSDTFTIPENAKYAYPYVNLKGTTSDIWFSIALYKDGYTYNDAGMYHLNENDVYERIM